MGTSDHRRDDEDRPAVQPGALGDYAGVLRRAANAGEPAQTQAPSGALGRRRVALGWVAAVPGPLLVSAVLTQMEQGPTTPLEALAFMGVTVLAAYAGGLWPGLVGATSSALLLNYFFTPPKGTLAIASIEDVVALGLFLLVATLVASAVGTAARRAAQAARAQHEADSLSMLNRTLLRGDHDLTALLELVRTTYLLDGVALLRQTADPPGPGVQEPTWRSDWTVVASTGTRPPETPDQGTATAPASADTRLVLTGRAPDAEEMRVLTAFAAHLAVVADRERLAAQTAAAQRLEEGVRFRTALLTGISHDLRTPLAGVKAAVSTLRAPGMSWEPADEAELLAAIENSADRLDTIIGNLLDLTRLQTGVVHLVTQDVGVDDVVARALRTIGNIDGVDAGRVRIDVPADLPAVRVDAGLLQRVVANLVQNALRYGAGSRGVEVTAEGAGDRVRLHVVDHGPGISDADKPRLFEPFHRLGDTPDGEGTGLGLAVASGLTEAMGGRLVAVDTPGGGLTMLVELPAAFEGSAPAAGVRPGDVDGQDGEPR